MSVTMGNPLFLAQMKAWIRELRHVSGEHAGTGACALASAMDLWLWTYRHLARSTDADGAKLVQAPRQGVTFKLADALGWLMAARMQILDAVALTEQGAAALGDAHAGTARFFADLCHVQAARAAGEVGRICAELVHGYNRHPAWDEQGAPPAGRRTTRTRSRGSSPASPAARWTCSPTAATRTRKALRVVPGDQ